MKRTFVGVVGVGVALSALLLVQSAVCADEVQLVNGDQFTASILSLDAKQLKVKSELLGEMTIERAKVRQITLGERLPAKPAPAATPSPGAADKAPLSLDDLFKQLQKAGGAAQLTPEAAIKQLEAVGGDPNALAELKKSMPLFAAPEVQAYFRKQVGGLLDGSLKIDDIRSEAIRVRNESKAVLKDLGPEAEAALAPYLGILEKFINETAPAAATPAEGARGRK